MRDRSTTVALHIVRRLLLGRARRVRLFVALELPGGRRRGARAVGARGGAARACGVLPAESLHVTLAFLGERPDEEAEAIGEAVAACARAGAAGCGSASRRGWAAASALALDLVDGAGRVRGAAGRCVAEALAALGAYEPEQRPFRPHVTVARVRRGARVARGAARPARRRAVRRDRADALPLGPRRPRGPVRAARARRPGR